MQSSLAPLERRIRPRAKEWTALILAILAVVHAPTRCHAKEEVVWTPVNGTFANAGTTIYGTQGVASASNYPGARQGASTWTDASGNLWLLGGAGYDGAGDYGFLNDLWKYDATTGLWTWGKGSSTKNAAGAHGTEEVEDAGNAPGARTDAVSWVDASGNMWLFGGDNGLNDVWKFNPTTGNWTWVSGSSAVGQTSTYGVQGVAAASNMPGARYGAASWVDASHDLWVFGGYSIIATSTGVAYNNTTHKNEIAWSARSYYLNDLWKFDPTTSMWTWVAGSNTADPSGTYGAQGVADSANAPGGRESAASWIDASGNFWLLGGYGHDGSGNTDHLNDLWKFDPTTGYWTWVKGSATICQSGTYGTQGVTDAANAPGAREGAGAWKDASGNFWLFGGLTHDSSKNDAWLSDLWKFNPTTSNWTWVTGSSATNQSGVHGAQGVASATNMPGARHDMATWGDASGNLWLFGGSGKDGTAAKLLLRDLWKFNPTTGKWAWIMGVSTSETVGNYGTQGQASASNTPGLREEAITWSDGAGNLWAFGGRGRDASGSDAWFSDLWKYDASTGAWTWLKGASEAGQASVTSGTLGVFNSTNVPCARSQAASWRDASGKLWLFGGQKDTADPTAVKSLLNDLWEYDPTTNNWALISGSTSFNQLGTYGTQGVAASTNVPGSRAGAASWTDASGNLWLHGGVIHYGAIQAGTYDAEARPGNDLWKFDPAACMWTWVAGASTAKQSGIYALTTSGSAYVPGARARAAKWTDASGDFWLFGGHGCDANGKMGRLNDLWKFDVTAGTWTWVNGSSVVEQAGTYGTQGVADASNVPGSRYGASSWTDASGNFWLFGGQALSAASTGTNKAPIRLNDLWKYDATTGKWTWVKGSSTSNHPGSFTAQGVIDSSNCPGARGSAAACMDSSGKLWLWGGFGYDCSGTFDILGDLWSGEIVTGAKAVVSQGDSSPSQKSGGTIDLGTTSVGAAPLSATLVIKNVGTEDLRTSSTTVSSPFLISTTTGSTVDSNSSATLVISLPTSMEGTFFTTLAFTTNDSTMPTFTVTVTGTITTPKLAVYNGTTALDNGTTITLFSATQGSAAQWSAAQTVVLTIKNEGTEALTLGMPSFDAPFSIVTAPSAVVAAGESTTLAISLATTSIGTFSQTLTLTTNDPDATTYALTIVGKVFTLSAARAWQKYR